ncbi:MAG: NYN domain-containing protein [candidate division NC10 bacterium]|nr:NYN domain-containing protein [candidate division NC10 bacterium]
MRVIVDGYNLIRQSPSLSQLDRQDMAAGRHRLIEHLAQYQRIKGHQITVVFDGWELGGLAQGQERVRGISVIFSRKGERADEVIKRMATQGVVVVTSDRDLRDFVERAGATTIGSEDFESRLELAIMADLKGLEEEEEDPVRCKGLARRLPKARRRREAQLRKL